MSNILHWIRSIANECYAVAAELAGLLNVIHIRRKPRQLLITVTAPRLAHTFTAVLLIGAASGLVYSLTPVVSPPASLTPSRQVTAQVDTPSKHLTRSPPIKLEIPSVSITTSLITLGKNADGTLAAPERYDVAGWYEYAPTPGQLGPAIIVGHVDNYLGPAVFYNLRNMQAGQSIFVTRQDNKVVEFKVESVELFDQQNFPTHRVYGNLDYAGLRLITCGGTFNPLTGHYSHNTVVYARLVSSSIQNAQI